MISGYCRFSCFKREERILSISLIAVLFFSSLLSDKTEAVTVIGTPLYMAPEVDGTFYNAFKADSKFFFVLFILPILLSLSFSCFVHLSRLSHPSSSSQFGRTVLFCTNCSWALALLRSKGAPKTPQNCHSTFCKKKNSK